MTIPFHTKIGILSILVVSHSVIGLSSVLSIIFYSFNKHNILLDSLAFLNVASFLLYKKCIAIDIYETVRDGETNLPNIAKDNFIRNNIKSFKNEAPSKDLTNLRLDVISNVKPMVNIDSEVSMTTLFSRKIHYIVINMILCITLLAKYNMQKFIPVILIWIFSNFPM